MELAQAAFGAVKGDISNSIFGPPPPPPPAWWEKLLWPAVNYVKENPGTTLLRTGSALTIFFPVVGWMPACLGLGFGTIGPAAGWLAPAFQSVFGTPIVFKTLQSAMMGGWGGPTLDGIFRGGALATGVGAEVYRWMRGG